MERVSEFEGARNLLGPAAQANVRRDARRPRPPIWLASLLAVLVLYGVTFTIGLLVSNNAERRFAANETPAAVAYSPSPAEAEN